MDSYSVRQNDLKLIGRDQDFRKMQPMRLQKEAPMNLYIFNIFLVFTILFQLLPQYRS